MLAAVRRLIVLPATSEPLTKSLPLCRLACQLSSLSLPVYFYNASRPLDRWFVGQYLAFTPNSQASP